MEASAKEWGKGMHGEDGRQRGTKRNQEKEAERGMNNTLQIHTKMRHSLFSPTVPDSYIPSHCQPPSLPSCLLHLPHSLAKHVFMDAWGRAGEDQPEHRE